jgi:calcineurin-like phosphoesterase family protein
MATWFTADLHLGHGNIIGYTTRPFPDAEAMGDALVERWKAAVDDGDTVWVLGDFALGRLQDTLPLAGRLRGRKILLAGNHDRGWAGHRKGVEDWVRRYLDAGFDEIRQGTETTTIAGETVLLCHFPYRGDSHDHDRHVEHRPPDTGQWLLHGHVHETWGQRGRMINVGVDATGFFPVAEERIAELIAAGPADRARIS